MNDSEFRALCVDAFNEFVKLVPNPKTRYKKGGSTGNMALNAAKVEFPSPDKCVIYIDEKIAPYLPFTNEAWVAERWHGKKNPNEGWFERAADYIASYVSEKLQGEAKNDSNKDAD